MVTLEKLKDHIKKAKKQLDEEVKKAENPKVSATVREKKKKVKRLTRKANKMLYIEKKAEDKRKSKKSLKAGGES